MKNAKAGRMLSAANEVLLKECHGDMKELCGMDMSRPCKALCERACNKLEQVLLKAEPQDPNEPNEPAAEEMGEQPGEELLELDNPMSSTEATPKSSRELFAAALAKAAPEDLERFAVALTAYRNAADVQAIGDELTAALAGG